MHETIPTNAKNASPHFVAIILLLDTFKNQIIPFWPTLDNYLTYIFETSNNIYIITKDLFNNYK